MNEVNENTTPEQIINDLLNEAAKTKSLKPVTQAIDFMEKLIASINGHMHHFADTMGKVMASTQIRSDRNTLTLSLITKMLIEKQIITKEEFEERYNNDVIKILEEQMKRTQERHQAKMKEMEQAAEEGKVQGEVEAIKEEKEEEYSGDVILASERFKKED